MSRRGPFGLHGVAAGRRRPVVAGGRALGGLHRRLERDRTVLAPGCLDLDGVPGVHPHLDAHRCRDVGTGPGALAGPAEVDVHGKVRPVDDLRGAVLPVGVHPVGLAALPADALAPLTGPGDQQVGAGRALGDGAAEVAVGRDGARQHPAVHVERAGLVDRVEFGLAVLPAVGHRLDPGDGGDDQALLAGDLHLQRLATGHPGQPGGQVRLAEPLHDLVADGVPVVAEPLTSLGVHGRAQRRGALQVPDDDGLAQAAAVVAAVPDGVRRAGDLVQ